MKPWLKKIFLLFAGGLLGSLILILFGLLILTTKYHQRIYPGVTVSHIPVGGLTQTQAAQVLDQAVAAYRSTWPIGFSDANGAAYSVADSPEAIRFATADSAAAAYQAGRSFSVNSLTQLVSLLYRPPTFALQVTVDPSWLDQQAASIAASVDIPVIPPQLEVVNSSTDQPVIQVNPGRHGQTFDQPLWKTWLIQSITWLQPPVDQLPIIPAQNTITADQIAHTQAVATRLLSSSLEITFVEDSSTPARSWQLTGPDLIKFIRFDDSFDRQLLADYLGGVAASVDRPPKDAKFKFDEATGKVVEFIPAENGLALDLSQSQERLYQALVSLAAGQTVPPVQLVFASTSPDISLSEVNRLGIKEKIGVGTSLYKGSIASRVHNVALAAARLNGTLIKPGQEFSFNQAVGGISAATGYQAAYIIQNGRTELGDGGGVCQDSTTMFRAALDAGLPITVRKGHAYRVGYYEQDAKPGLDATVFSPSTDFKFVNDTPAHILIQAEADTANRRLTITLYGTSDGRKSEISDHVIWDVTPPPPDVYVDDPTLAPGQVKQIDWKAPGTKAKFTYRVTRNGEVLQDKTFVTNYKPWAAVFLRGPQQ